jgi:hypothetical protein
MSSRIAIAAYRCEIAGVPEESLDIQVRYFDDPSVDIESFLRDEPTHSYPTIAVNWWRGPSFTF